MMEYNLYTDGSARPNPGPGGWAAYCVELDKLIGGTKSCASNNEMEMLAILNSLSLVPDNSSITIHTDSKMTIGWLCRGWKCRSNPKIIPVRTAIENDNAQIFRALGIKIPKFILSETVVE